MEPRKQVLEKSTEQRKEATKSRFQILKLEERIAPAKGGIPGRPWGCPPGRCDLT